MKTVLWLLTFLGFSGIIYSQEAISSHELTGTWAYFGPQTISLNDTVILKKGNEAACSQWTFKPQDNELEMHVHIEEDDDKNKAIDVKSNGIEWSLKAPDLLVIHYTDKDKYLKVLENSNFKIILVRIK